MPVQCCLLGPCTMDFQAVHNVPMQLQGDPRKALWRSDLPSTLAPGSTPGGPPCEDRARCSAPSDAGMHRTCSCHSPEHPWSSTPKHPDHVRGLATSTWCTLSLKAWQTPDQTTLCRGTKAMYRTFHIGGWHNRFVSVDLMHGVGPPISRYRFHGTGNWRTACASSACSHQFAQHCPSLFKSTAFAGQI